MHFRGILSRCLPVAWCLLLAAPGLAQGQIACAFDFQNSIPTSASYIPDGGDYTYFAGGTLTCERPPNTANSPAPAAFFVSLIPVRIEGRNRNRYLTSVSTGRLLSYNLFSGEFFTDSNIWTDTSPLSLGFIVIQAGETTMRNFYHDVPIFFMHIHPGQRVPAGDYIDLISITIVDSVSGQQLGLTVLPVTVTVEESCSIGLAGGTLNFGNHRPNTVITATTDFTVLCNEGARYRIAANAGQHASNNGARRMKHPVLDSYIIYALFRDMEYSRIWGFRGNNLEGEGTGNPETHTVYGRISAHPRILPAGDYRDQVVFTVEID